MAPPTLGGGGSAYPLLFAVDDPVGVPTGVAPDTANDGVLALDAVTEGNKLVGGRVDGNAGVGVAGTAILDEAGTDVIAFLASRSDRLRSAFFLIAASRSVQTK